jgi:hypothetical protein
MRSSIDSAALRTLPVLDVLVANALFSVYCL